MSGFQNRTAKKISDTKSLSKFLSLILRHKPEVVDVKLDDNGWVLISTLIDNINIQSEYIIDRSTLQSIVDTNDKKRFIISPDGLSIRANQGHSVDVDLALAEKTPPAILYHGTAIGIDEIIINEGIKKMNRTHVHLSLKLEVARQVGSRHGKPVILTVRANEMHKAGYKFYVSDNGVWLTDFVPPEYIGYLL